MKTMTEWRSRTGCWACLSTARKEPIPLGWLPNDGSSTDRVGDQSVVLVGIPDAGAVRAYDSQDNVFTPGDNLDEVIDQDGGVWLVREDGLFNAESDSTLSRLHGRELFWFAWTAFLPLY